MYTNIQKYAAILDLSRESERKIFLFYFASELTANILQKKAFVDKERTVRNGWCNN